MKSTRRPARSRSVGYRLDALRELVIAPIIYLVPLMICTAPLLFLYWLYRPTVLTNPGLSSLKEPVTMAFSLPPSQSEPREDAGTLEQAALADVAEDFIEPKPADEKAKSPSGSRESHKIVGHCNLRFAGNVKRPAPAYNVGAAVAGPGRYTGMSWGAASAYAYAAEPNGRHRW
jgi:hypothetical protein